MQKIKCFLGLHNPLNCYRFSSIENKDERQLDLDWQGIWAYDHRITFPNPWSSQTIVETKYKCSDCGKTFFYARMDFEKLKYYRRNIEWVNRLLG